MKTKLWAISILYQSLGISQKVRKSFNPIEAAFYPKDTSDADGVKERDKGRGTIKF